MDFLLLLLSQHAGLEERMHLIWNTMVVSYLRLLLGCHKIINGGNVFEFLGNFVKKISCQQIMLVQPQVFLFSQILITSHYYREKLISGNEIVSPWGMHEIFCTKFTYKFIAMTTVYWLVVSTSNLSHLWWFNPFSSGIWSDISQ